MPGLLTIKNIIIMKNLKYLPYAAFLVLAAVSYSCSDDDGGGGNRGGGGNGGGGAATSGSGMPTTAELGVEWPMSRVVDYDTEYLRLDYDADGRLTGGYDGSFGGNFTIETSPLAIEYRDTDPSYDNRHSVTDIKVNEDGYIVSARVTEIWDEPSAPSENWSVDGTIELEYNSDGRVTQVVERCNMKEYDYESSFVVYNTFTWQDGRIAMQVYSYEDKYTEDGQYYTDSGEERREYSYEDSYANTGVYADLDELETVYTSLWYSGLFGKAPTQLPSSYVASEYEDGQPVGSPWSGSKDVTYYSDGRIRTYENYYTFHYYDAPAVTDSTAVHKAAGTDRKHGAKAAVERLRAHRAARH